jgi:hypothetical protein
VNRRGRPHRVTRHPRSSQPRKPGSRALIALANALLAFATAAVVWLVLFQVFSGMVSSTPPFMPVIIFAALLGALSFVLDIDLILHFFARLWRLLGQLLSKLS